MTYRSCILKMASATVLLCLLAMFDSAFAQTAPTLGTAQSFAILGASAVTNTGPSIINGNLGVSPGTAITGFPPGIVNGTIHAADAVAAQAQSDANTAYNSLAGQPCNTILTGQDLGGLTLTPGVYCYTSSAQLTGTLTLNGQGNPNAVFIFKIGSTLITASNSSVVLVNGGSPCNIFFQVGSSATLGTGTQFIGNIFALASVTLTTNVTIAGRAIGLNGAVTLDSNVVSVPTCGGVPTTGFVQVCAVAGPGVPVGTNITFNVGGTVVTLAAGAAPGGTCSSPISVPTGPVIVTETIPGGTTVTGISTSPSGALITSNLPAGTATVTVTPGGQTTVTFITAAIPPPPNGFVQVCKVAGAGVAVGTNFTFSVAGTPVTIAAGAAPGGTCGTPIVAPPGAAVVTETIPAGTLVAGVSTLPSAGLLVSSNLSTGTATVTVISGGTTILTFVDAAIPIVPTNGFVQVCKVAGAGVAVGTNFTFSVAGTPVVVAAGTAPGGTCAAPVTVPAGSAVITETIPAGTLLSGISTLPSAALLTSSNLAAGTATVTVNAGGQTIVTFIDTAIPVVPNTGFVQVCKVAGVGVPLGTNFTFNVAGTPVTVPAGVAPGGTCATPVTVPAGTAVVTETVPAGVVLTAVSTLPSAALLVSSNLPAGTASVTVNVGGETIVTFIDAAIPNVPTNGVIQICKIAGAGVATGTLFTFNVAGAPVTVAAGPAPGGTCATPVTVPTGTAVITETIPAGTLVAGVSTLPSAGLLVSSNLAAGTATVTVLASGLTIVTFIDAAIPVVPTTGFLQVCKIAGAGITVGTNFTFNVAGTPVTVPAGVAPGGTCAIPITVPAGPAVITEAAVVGTGVAGISTLPSGLLVSSDLSARTATVTVVAGGQTIVTFIDAVPTTGLVQVCKVAGTGVAVGTPFTFTFAGTTITIPAGATPGSSCSPALVAPIGPALITEAVSPAQGEYQIRYASNLNIGDSVVNLTNTGTLTNPGALSTSGNICVNVYTFDASEELVSCCSCLVTPNGLNSLSVKQDLVSNTLTPGVPSSVVIKLLATIPLGLGPDGTGGTCNPSSPAVSNLLPSGMKAWGTTLHALPTTPVTYGLSETPFESADLGLNGLTAVSTAPNAGLLISSNPVLGTATVTVTPGGQTIVTFTNALGSAELTKLTTFCGFIQANGSGFGICKSCRTGGLGAAQK
jgi:Ice-binding-like